MKMLLTWGELTMVLGALLIFYYAGWLLVFYRRTLNRLLQLEPSARWERREIVTPATPAANNPGDPDMQQVAQLLQEADLLMTHLPTGSDEATLLQSMRSLLQRFPSLKISPLQASVNHHLSGLLYTRFPPGIPAEKIQDCW